MIAVPGDGPVSWTAREDAAEAAALIILSNGAYDGPVTLTATMAPTFDDIARIASELSGRTIERVIQDPDEWSAGQLAAGRPPFLSFYQAAERGFFAGVDPLLATLLGRAPQTVRDALTQPAAH